MTEAQARAEADKRERHKGKSLSHKTWTAAHNSVRGWHPALVDKPRTAPAKPAHSDAYEALMFVAKLRLARMVAEVLAQGTEARSDETPSRLGPQGDGPVAKPCAQDAATPSLHHREQARGG